jgi:hypothetical protein
MREIYFLLRLSFLLVTISCSKGKDKKDSDNNENITRSTARTDLKGIAMNALGYLEQAKVCFDKNKNKKCDPSESSTTTDSTGKFEIKLEEQTLTDDAILLTEIIPNVTTASKKLLTETSVIQAAVQAYKPNEKIFISTISDLVVNQAQNNKSSISAATTAVKKVLEEAGINTSEDNFTANTQEDATLKKISLSINRIESKSETATTVDIDKIASEVASEINNPYWEYSNEEITILLSLGSNSVMWEICFADIKGKEKHIMYYDYKAFDEVDFSVKGELKLTISKEKGNTMTLKTAREEDYNKCRENTSKQKIMEYLKISDNEYASVSITSNSKQDFTDSIISRVEICNTNTNELKKFTLDKGDNIVEKLGDTYNGKPSIEIQNNNELISISYPRGAQLVKIDNGAAIYNSCKNKILEAKGCKITYSDGHKTVKCEGLKAAEAQE